MRRWLLCYVTDHWAGRHKLAHAFWINLVLLQLTIQFLQHVLRPAAGSDYRELSLLVFSLAFVFHGIVFVWQAVGVLRASEQYVRDYGSMSVVWGVQLVVAGGLFIALNGVIGAWEMTREVPVAGNLQTLAALERASQYRLDVADEGREVRFSGRIVLGATTALEQLLAAESAVRRIALESAGGNVFEARGMSRVIRERRLDTFVDTHCLSACTTVFIGGLHRALTADARLGFHQYRIEADYAVPLLDTDAAQARDRELYRQAGVDAAFIERMFERDASDMWFPSTALLRAAGVVTRVPNVESGSSR